MSDDDIMAAGIVAEADQLRETLARTAVATAAYFSGLLEQGMTRREAMTLTRDWQGIYFTALYDGFAGMSIVDDDE